MQIQMEQFKNKFICYIDYLIISTQLYVVQTTSFSVDF